MTAATRRVQRRPRGRSTLGRIAFIVFATIAAMGGLGAVAVVGGYMALSADLVSPEELTKFRPAEESIVYDRTGTRELARFGELKRDIVTFDEIPPILIDATTAIEDKTFWTNSGFDPAAIAAAGLDALRGNARGASTITQQLVRARLLDSDLVQSKDRTVERKLKEIVQSVRLTQFFPGQNGKKEIIAAYLNQNYYGNNSYGVKAAARSYFDKELEELTLAEVAILAALPQSPSNYDLVRNAIEREDGTLVVPADTDIVRRRNLVLDFLAQPDRRVLSRTEYSAAQIEAAKEEPVLVAEQTDDRWAAPHFVWQVRDELAARVCGEGVQSCEKLEQGGYRIITTLDLELQRTAERWVRLAARVPRLGDPEKAARGIGFDTLEPWVEALIEKDLNNGALVALDYQTGELIAYVGSADYYSRSGNAKFQPKFDVIGDGWRQPGSAFKPFNYLTGVDDRTLTAATMFMDVG
ncbi:MAG: transglycosylase domain-containing protein, partial [Chloroflexi bacterium]|nr:transglycosylase domain-containing protein [Chloroflexota bacterium]